MRIYSVCLAFLLVACGGVHSEPDRDEVSKPLPTNDGHLTIGDLFPKESVHSPNGSIVLRPPEGWLLLGHPQMREHTVQMIEQRPVDLLDAAIGVLSQSQMNVRCRVGGTRLRLSAEDFKEDESQVFHTPTWAQMTMLTVIESGFEPFGDFKSFTGSADSHGPRHIRGNYQWEFQSENGQVFAFGEVDLQDSLARVSACHWYVGAPRGNEQLVNFAVRDSVFFLPSEGHSGQP